MIRGTIRVPQNIISGAFPINISFQRPVNLTADDINMELVEGDALGHPKDRFHGDGSDYSIICYLDDNKAGISIVSIDKEGTNVLPEIVRYDTVRYVRIRWHEPVSRNSLFEIPFYVETPVDLLKKRNFLLEPNTRHHIYHLGDNNYKIVCRNPINKITAFGQVTKANGVAANIKESVLEVSE